MTILHNVADYFSGNHSKIKSLSVVGRNPRPEMVQRFVRTEILPRLENAFPFVLQGDDFSINEAGQYTYSRPTDEEYELIATGLAPLPHDVITLEASVFHPSLGVKEERMWLLWKEDDGALFNATTLFVCKDRLYLYGTKLRIFPELPENNLRVDECLGADLNDTDADDLFFQVEFLSFVLLMLNAKTTQTEYEPPSASANRKRAKHGKTAIKGYTSLRFPHSVSRSKSSATSLRNSPRPHWRRTHTRRQRGKTILIGRHLVGMKDGGPIPGPQTYQVDPFPR